jgi:hypothetical protein
MVVDGKVLPAKRAEILRDFRRSKKPEVLLLSQVGLTGLNLDCANILVILVSTNKIAQHLINFAQDVLWSGLDDRQLVERLHRQPQEKQVFVYRLLSMRTPDMILSRISVGKQRLYENLMWSELEISKYFIDHYSIDLL